MRLPLKEVAPYFSPRRLRLLVLPTEKCNFRCTYCYEDFAIGRMSAPIANAVVALVEQRSADLDSLDLDWFGGEPLLAQSVVYSVSGAIADISHRNGLAYRGSITTNGYMLTLQVADELLARGIARFQVTLDGPADVHDRRRPTVSGQPTFQTISHNLDQLLATDRQCQLTIRVHYDKATYPRVRDFVATDVAGWARDTRVDVLFAHVENLSGDVNGHVPQMTPEEKREAVSQLRSFVSRGVSKGDKAYVCYAAQPNAFVIRADGRVAKCTVALDDERNTIGRLTADGQLVLDGGQVAPWLGGWATADERRLSCPYSYIKKTDGDVVIVSAGRAS